MLFASPPMLPEFEVTSIYCMALIYDDPDDEFGITPSLVWPGYEYWEGTLTCYGRDLEKRPPAPKEKIAIEYPERGICDMYHPEPKQAYFFWKAKMLPDGRFQVFCSSDATYVEKARYFALDE